MMDESILSMSNYTEVHEGEHKYNYSNNYIKFFLKHWTHKLLVWTKSLLKKGWKNSIQQNFGYFPKFWSLLSYFFFPHKFSLAVKILKAAFCITIQKI